MTMKILFLDLSMGAAGDMFAAALYELTEDKAGFMKEINAAGISGVKINAQAAARCGICGTHMQVLVNGSEETSEDAGREYARVEHEHSHEEHEHVHEEHARSHEEHGHGHHHHHSHRSMADIEAIIDALNISDKVKADAKAVYKIIADAESKAHGMEVSEIHFHEVGTMDAVADIVMSCMLVESLCPDKVIASSVCTGFGHVNCAHGIICVPAPATAYILEDIPSYEGDIEAELCTPTGAALVKYFADEYGRMPVMTDKKTGYGMGSKEFEKLNAVRAVIGNAEDETDKITELSLTVDDMTGEEIAFACERLFEAGAVDVYTRPVYMKKGRPGFLIDVLAKADDEEKITAAIFKYTSTLGIRQTVCERYILKRETQIIKTPYGPVRKKVSEGYGAHKEKYEYEDIARIASQAGLSMEQIKKDITEK